MPHILVTLLPPIAQTERVTLVPQGNSAFNFVIWEVPGFEHLLSLALPSFLSFHSSSGLSPASLLSLRFLPASLPLPLCCF